MERYKYVIVGGGIAGQRAVDGIRRVDQEGTVALISAERHLPYQRPPLSKGYLQGKEGLDKVYLKGLEYYQENGVELITGLQVVELLPGQHTVRLQDGREIGYAKLLLATGGRAKRLPLLGADLPGALTLRTIEDANAIREAGGEGRRVVVFGGSFIGSEVSASLTQLGSRVTMVFPEKRLLERIVPADMSEFLESKFKAEGIRILKGRLPYRLQGDGHVQCVLLRDGTALKADLVVMGVGIDLNTELAEAAGLELTGPKKAVVVDEKLRTSDADIYAAGDIAAWPDPTFGRRLRVEHWDVARAQGLRAGRNMAGEARPYTTLPYFFSDLFELSFELWGSFDSWDTTVNRGKVGSESYAIYYFDQGRLTGVLAAGRPKAERDPMQALVRQRPALDDVAAKLQDEGLDLTTLVNS
ncbi:MAG: FAD-dependent oxidoreductase [Chloroflexi bacterium]|nr:FAD-dependent oxidoreductase [Chloroflexota bacterium]